jgi:hypothetical protein
VLEVLAKLPPTEKLQPYLPQLMQVRACVRVWGGGGGGSKMGRGVLLCTVLQAAI